MIERRGREKFSPEGSGPGRSSLQPPRFSALALVALFAASVLSLVVSGLVWWQLLALAWERFTR